MSGWLTYYCECHLGVLLVVLYILAAFGVMYLIEKITKLIRRLGLRSNELHPSSDASLSDSEASQ